MFKKFVAACLKNCIFKIKMTRISIGKKYILSSKIAYYSRIQMKPKSSLTLYTGRYTTDIPRKVINIAFYANHV
jgi:hypothetical protein